MNSKTIIALTLVFICICLFVFIRRSTSRAASVGGWESLPISFVQELKNRLGLEKFKTLDSVAKKYKIFDQALFKNPEIFEEESLEFDKNLVFDGSSRFDIFAGFLNSLGRQLINQGYLNDGEIILSLSIDVMPRNNFAHVILAILYSQNKQIEKAKKEARIALKVIEALERREEAQNEFIPDEIKEMTPPVDYVLMRKMMLEILNRETSK
jgi:tetratricopeptide (TPR) repeat protein